MNKKAAETTVMMTGIKLILGAIIALILISLVFKLTEDSGKKEEQTNYFYFTKLIGNLNEMSIGDAKISAFLSNKDIILLSFNKDQESIKKGDLNKCINYVSLQDVKKPVKCRDENCLCLCQSGLPNAGSGEFYIYNKLSINCESESARCSELPLKISPPNDCNNFVLYNEAEKLYDLELKKDKDAFSINIK